MSNKLKLVLEHLWRCLDEIHSGCLIHKTKFKFLEFPLDFPNTKRVDSL